MADETAKTSLVFDASGAIKGAEEFVRAGQQILQSLQAVQAAADKAAKIVGTAEVEKANARASSARKAKESSTVEAAAATAGADAVVTATNRVVKATSTQMAALDRYAKMWDPFANAAARAGRQIDTVWDIAQKTSGATQQRAFNLLPEAIDRTNKALRNASAGFDIDKRIEQLTNKFDPATTSARAMTAELKDLNDALKLGVVDAGQYVAKQAAIIESYDQGAQAAKRAAEAQRELIEQTRSAQNAVNAQGAFDRQLGVASSPGSVGGRAVSGVKSAAESAAVFQRDMEDQKEADAGLAQIAARAGQLAAKFDPVTASAKAMAAELAELNEAQSMGVNIAGGYQKAWEAIVEKYDEGAAAAKREADAQAHLIEQAREEQAQTRAAAAQQAFNTQLGVGGSGKSASQSAGVFQEQFEAEAKLAQERQVLIQQFDPLTAAAQRYAGALANIQRAQELNVISPEQAAARRNAETASYGKGATDLNAATKYMGNFRDSAFGARFATQQLGVQTIQFFSSLQAGQPFMQAFIGQAHQVVDVAISTGTGFRTLTTAIAGWASAAGRFAIANPVLVGLTAISAAMGTLGVLAESTARRMEGLRDILSGTRNDYLAASKAADDAAKHLAAGHSGEITTAQARTATQTLFADQGFHGTQEQVDQISLAFARLSKQLGETEPNFTRMGQALHDPVAVLTELRDKGLKGIDDELIRTARNFADAGQVGKAFGVAMEAIVKQTANVHNELTPIQKALEDLGNQFRNAGQGGRSMADLIGSISDTAAVAAIKTLTGVVRDFKEIYDLLKNLAPSGGSEGGFWKVFWEATDTKNIADNVAALIKSAFGGGTGEWLKSQLAAPGATQTAVSSAGALGTMQLMPSTARGLDVNPFIPTENIRGGLKYIQQLSGRFGAGNEDMIARAYNVGPAGHVWSGDAASYASKVAGANIANLPTDTTAQIEFWGEKLGLPRNLIDLGKRIAMVENAGHQGPVSKGGRYVAPETGGEIKTAAEAAGAPSTAAAAAAGPGNMGKDDATVREAIALAEKYRTELHLLDDTQNDLTNHLHALEAGKKAAFDKGDTTEVERINKAIAALNGELYRTISPQEQIIRQTNLQAQSAQVLTEGDQKLAAALQQLNEINKEHPDTASEAQKTALMNAVLKEQSGEYRKLAFEIGLQIGQQHSVAEAYSKGYDAVVHATAANKALLDSMKRYPLDSDAQKEAAKALTVQYEALAKAEQEVQAAQQHATNREIVANLNAEVDALSMSSLERERYLAHVKEDLELKRLYPTLSAEARQALLSENDAIVAQQQALQVHKQAMDELAGAFTQSFDTIGNAITQSFVQGTGAAVNWKNVMTSVLQQVIQQFAKLAIINPALNALFPSAQHRSTLEDVFNAPEKIGLPAANDNLNGAGPLAAAKDAAAKAIGTASGGLPIDSTLNAVRVTNVGLGGLPAPGSGDGGSSGESAGSDTGSSVTGSFANSSGGGSSETQSAGGGFLGSIGGALKGVSKFIGEFPKGALDPIFGKGFYQGGGLIGQLFGGGGNEQIPVDTGGPQIFSDAGIVPGAGGVVDDGLFDVPVAAHTGGLVGVDQFQRHHSPVPSSVWMNAPRFHAGMNSDEFGAILQRGERVLTANQNSRLENLLGQSGSGAAAMTRAMQGMGRAANQNARTGDVTNNSGHTINVHVPGGMSSDDARRTGYQVGSAVAQHLSRVSQRNQP